MSNNNNSLIIIVSVIYIFLCLSSVSSFSSLLGFMTKGATYGDMSSVWSRAFGTSIQSGEWSSPVYGTMKNSKGSTCPSGSYITDMMIFHGQGDHTNAIQAWCYDPKSKNTSRIFDTPTCGKRDRTDAGAVGMIAANAIMAIAAAVVTVFFPPAGAAAWAGVAASVAGTTAGTALQIASAVDAKKDILKPQSGRKLWDYTYVGAPAGFYKWSVRPKDGEIKGLKVDAIDGQTTGWAGGNAGRVTGRFGPRRGVPSGKITTATCPKGKIVTGLKASCSDRVDGIQFICDVPPIR